MISAYVMPHPPAAVPEVCFKDLDNMRATMSSMMVAEYKLQLPDKEVLQKKLQELINIPMIED